MTIHSMTGFGAAESSHDGWAMKVECRSVNHRGLDVKVWSPREWGWVEPFALEVVKATFSRGRVEVRVDCAPERGVSGALLDTALFADLAAQLRAATTAAGLALPTAGDVLAFEEVRGGSARAEAPADAAPFEAAIRAAIAGLQTARAEEGGRLRITMDGLVAEVERCVLAVEAHAPKVAEEYHVRLETRVREALARFEVREVDDRSLLQEVALYADRSNVAEEVQRAKSHIAKLREVLEADASEPSGKQIDFYLQELFREANTTGSKSSSIEITGHVIAMKTAIEKMREQAANIE